VVGPDVDRRYLLAFACLVAVALPFESF